MNDLRDELLKTKKAYAMAVRENNQFRTKLQFAEKECKKRDSEIERLIQEDQGVSSKLDERIRTNSLRRKVLEYERLLHVKTQDNAELLADRNIVKAAETRKQVVHLETECERLRAHLAQSIPESEFLREKNQYLAIIDRLLEENMQLRQLLGEYEQRRKESDRLLVQMGGTANLVKEFRSVSLSSRRRANFYRSALNNLFNGERKTVLRRPTSSRKSRSVSMSRISGNLSTKRPSIPKRRLTLAGLTKKSDLAKKQEEMDTCDGEILKLSDKTSSGRRGVELKLKLKSPKAKKTEQVQKVVESSKLDNPTNEKDKLQKMYMTSSSSTFLDDEEAGEQGEAKVDGFWDDDESDREDGIKDVHHIAKKVTQIADESDATDVEIDSFFDEDINGKTEKSEVAVAESSRLLASKTQLEQSSSERKRQARERQTSETLSRVVQCHMLRNQMLKVRSERQSQMAPNF